MKILPLLLLALLPAVCFGQATNRITAKFTVITATSNNFALTGNTDTRTFTNSVTAAALQIITNHTVAGSASNLFSHLSSYPFARTFVTGYTNGSNVIYLRGDLGAPMAFSALSNWVTISYSTQVFSSGLTAVRVPIETEGTDAGINIASLLVRALGTLPTNTLPADATALLNHAPRTNAPLVTPSINGGAISNAALSALPSISGSNLTATTYTLRGSGSVSNANLINIAAANGNVGNITNGIFQSPKLTNSTLHSADAQIFNARLDTPSITNGVGSLVSPTLYNRGTVGPVLVTNENDGEETWLVMDQADGDEASQIYFNFAGVFRWVLSATTNSFSIGAPSDPLITIVPGGMTLGDGRPISLSGNIASGSYSNSTFHGTNRFNGAIAMPATNVTGVANGDILLDVGLLRTVHTLSGNSAAVNICGIKYGHEGRQIRLWKTNGFDLVIRNASGAAGTAANERILTGTGADATFNDAIECVELTYNGEQQVWFLHRKPQ